MLDHQRQTQGNFWVYIIDKVITLSCNIQPIERLCLVIPIHNSSLRTGPKCVPHACNATPTTIPIEQ